MALIKLLFVHRKPHPGNFSIERIYNAIQKELEKEYNSTFNIKKLVLKRNYDFKAFTVAFFRTLFQKSYKVHITGACSYMVMAFPFKKRVLTIHDLFRYKELRGLKRMIYRIFYISLPLYFAEKVVAISEVTKKDILKESPSAITKIAVISNPMVIHAAYITHRKRIFSQNTPISILQIGANPIKNYERLIQATLNLNVVYHFIHTNPSRINILIDKYDIGDKSWVHSVLNEKELCALYSKCDVLYFASEREGFGLPIIEAQAFGLPVITSNFPPMSNVGEGGILVDPFSIEDIRDGFLKLYVEKILDQHLGKVPGNILKYDLRFITDQYRSLYESIC